MKRTIILLLFLSSFSVYSQDNSSITNQGQIEKTIYFDKDWNEVAKGKHKYYSVFCISEIPYNEEYLYKVTEYLKNGKKHGEGYSSSQEKINAQALYTHYKKNGDIDGYLLYDYDRFHNFFPIINQYISKINVIEYDKKILLIKLEKHGIRAIGFLNNEKKEIGEWKIFNKNGIYFVANFKKGENSSIERVYNKNDELIRKQYYLTKSNKKQNPSEVKTDRLNIFD